MMTILKVEEADTPKVVGGCHVDTTRPTSPLLMENRME